MGEGKDPWSYTNEFCENLGNNWPFKKKDKVLQEAVEEFINDRDLHEVVSEFNARNDSEDGVVGIQEKISKSQKTAKFLGNRIPALNGCNTWRDIGKKFVKEGWEGLKEVFFLQIFAGGVFLLIIENTTPSVKYVIGPKLIEIGYKNNKLLQRYTPQKIAEMFPEADFTQVKGFPI